MTKREQLHEFIDLADEDYISAIYTLVVNKETFVGNKYNIDEGTMSMLEEEMENYRKGLGKSYTNEEVLNYIRQLKK